MRTGRPADLSRTLPSNQHSRGDDTYQPINLENLVTQHVNELHADAAEQRLFRASIDLKRVRNGFLSHRQR
jgi:hypothetical protein